MKEEKWDNKRIKAYYRDCGKGLRDGDLRIVWGKIRGFPSFLYQNKRITETIKEISRLKLMDRILDAACGSGYILASLPPGSVGIEINPRHVAAAKKLAPQARVIQGDIEKIPFPKNSFSAVLVAEIFEHIPEPSGVISEMWRVLRKGGFLVVTVPTNNPLWRLRFLASSMYSSEPLCLSFSKDSLLALFTNYDYRVKEFKRIAFGLNYLLILQKV